MHLWISMTTWAVSFPTRNMHLGSLPRFIMAEPAKKVNFEFWLWFLNQVVLWWLRAFYWKRCQTKSLSHDSSAKVCLYAIISLLTEWETWPQMITLWIYDLSWAYKMTPRYLNLLTSSVSFWSVVNLSNTFVFNEKDIETVLVCFSVKQ